MKDKLYKMMDWAAIEGIVYAEEPNPETILGRHQVGTNVLFQTFQPNAKAVTLVFDDEKDKDKTKEYTMELADEAGFYAVSVLGKLKSKYHYHIVDINGKKKTIYDPYSFDIASLVDLSPLGSGSCKNAYEILGAHVKSYDGVDGTLFAVWAPNAIRVSVVGDFNGWDGKHLPMVKDAATGVFALFVPGIGAGTAYKYEIASKGGQVYTKMDPYAVSTKDGSAIVPAASAYKWTDGKYERNREAADKDSVALNIYETELKALLDDKGALSADAISAAVNRLTEYSYDYVQLIMRSDDFYTLPNGVDADDFRNLITALHNANIGAIMEWNPSYFVDHAEGMSVFDGTYLYGHMDERKRYNPAFGGFYFNYGRPEVKDYLISNAYYWIKEYHLDGLHVDGLSPMLYLDYGKYEGEWVANIYGGHENLEAIDFVKTLNDCLHKDYPAIITTTHEEGAFRGVTDDVKNGGLGFDYIWNNGFGEDLLAFVKSVAGTPDVAKLADCMSYAYCENYILTMSKRDVLVANDYDHLAVEEGAGYLDKLDMKKAEKAALKRAVIAYMMAHTGKKLFYRGQDEEVQSIELNKLYDESMILNRMDRNPVGFEWIKAINTGDGVIAFLRKGEYIDQTKLIVCNFSNNAYPEYKLGVPYEGKYKMVFNSDNKKYGGKTGVNNRIKETEDEAYDGRENTLTLKLSPMSVTYYTYTPYTEKELVDMAVEKVNRYKAKVMEDAVNKAKALAGKTV